MSKSRDAKKEDKKKPQKSLKEKRMAKQEEEKEVNSLNTKNAWLPNNQAFLFN